MSYRKKLSSRNKRTGRSSQRRGVAAAQSAKSSDLPSPGLFAPGHEKDLAKALEAYRAGQTDEALEYFLEAATKEVGAAIFAAAILAEKDLKSYKAIQLLEGIVQSDDEFPTPLMEKYLATASINVAITPNVRATVPVGGLAVTLLLVELYQAQRRVREAIGLLEEVEELTGHPALTLSLCELYASRELWDGIIDRAKQTESLDNITLEILIFYGQALQRKGMPEAAVSIFTKALRRKKDRNRALLNEAMYWRALAYQQLGRHNRANQELQKLYAEDPDFRDVAIRLAEFSPR